MLALPRGVRGGFSKRVEGIRLNDVDVEVGLVVQRGPLRALLDRVRHRGTVRLIRRRHHRRVHRLGGERIGSRKLKAR